MSEQINLLVVIGENVPAPGTVTARAAMSTPIRGVAFAGAIVPDGGVAPYTYAITGGALPPGMSLDTSTGDVTGTPTSQGHYEYEVTVTDSAASAFSILYAIVVSGGIAWDVTDVPNVQHGVAYSAQLKVSGGTPPYTFNLEVGPLPPTLSFSSSGLLSGTGSEPGLAPVRRVFTLGVTDSAGNKGDKAYDTISWPAIVLSDDGNADGLVGAVYRRQIFHRYGLLLVPSQIPPAYWPEIPAIQYVVTAGALPPGLALDPLSGLVSGTPTTAGVYTYTITAANDLGGTATTNLETRIAAVTDIDRVYSDAFGDGVALVHTIVHDLDAPTPRSVVIHDQSLGYPYPEVECAWEVADSNSITVTTAIVIAPSQYLITITA